MLWSLTLKPGSSGGSLHAVSRRCRHTSQTAQVAFLSEYLTPTTGIAEVSDAALAALIRSGGAEQRARCTPKILKVNVHGIDYLAHGTIEH